jgi:hypothetical protein
METARERRGQVGPPVARSLCGPVGPLLADSAERATTERHEADRRVWFGSFGHEGSFPGPPFDRRPRSREDAVRLAGERGPPRQWPNSRAGAHAPDSPVLRRLPDPFFFFLTITSGFATLGGRNAVPLRHNGGAARMRVSLSLMGDLQTRIGSGPPCACGPDKDPALTRLPRHARRGARTPVTILATLLWGGPNRSPRPVAGFREKPSSLFRRALAAAGSTVPHGDGGGRPSRARRRTRSDVDARRLPPTGEDRRRQRYSSPRAVDL